ncbi:hypothetical protein L7F22_008306 [Adiantum nelumboides]|nr:hypothetical protein [Adiantum nelumboides]
MRCEDDGRGNEPKGEGHPVGVGNEEKRGWGLLHDEEPEEEGGGDTVGAGEAMDRALQLINKTREHEGKRAEGPWVCLHAAQGNKRKEVGDPWRARAIDKEREEEARESRDDERLSESKSERKYVTKPEKFYDFPNQKPHRQERYKRKRTRKSRVNKDKPMPLVKDKTGYLRLVKANDCVKDKVTGQFIKARKQENNKKNKLKRDGTKLHEGWEIRSGMTNTERKSEYNKLKKTLKDVWTIEMETHEDTNSDKMDVPSHYKKYTIQDKKIIVQQSMRELKEPGTSYDGLEKAKKIDLAEPGEEPKPAYIAIDLTEEEEKLLIATLKQYKDVFAWSYKNLKGVDPSVCQHTIPLKSDAKPSRQRPYTYNETFARKIKEEIDKLKEAEFTYEIEHTDWVSPIVVVPKKNKKLRVCINLKKGQIVIGLAWSSPIGSLSTRSSKLRQPQKVFSEETARFYLAEIVIALEYLHCQGIIYRDLKPENVLLRKDGHVVLTDFDLSFITSCTPQLVRPPSPPGRCQKYEPMPPPIFMAEPVNTSNSFVGTEDSAVDWWAVGILLYEMIYGRTPFRGKNRQKTFANVLHKDLTFPCSIPASLAARQLINGLLHRDPANRLGSATGAYEIKNHAFFRDINWPLIREMVSPCLDAPLEFVGKDPDFDSKEDLDWDELEASTPFVSDVF